MLAKVKTAAVVGLDAQEVEVEVDILSGLPAMNVGGQPGPILQGYPCGGAPARW
jgi:hypothetical protein